MVTTVEELRTRQTQLETEVSQLKETVFRLNHRVAVLETFIKSKHGCLPTIPDLDVDASVNGNVNHVSSVNSVKLSSLCQNNHPNETAIFNSQERFQQPPRQEHILSNGNGTPLLIPNKPKNIIVSQRVPSSSILSPHKISQLKQQKVAIVANQNFQPESHVVTEHTCVPISVFEGSQFQKVSDVDSKDVAAANSITNANAAGTITSSCKTVIKNSALNLNPAKQVKHETPGEKQILGKDKDKDSYNDVVNVNVKVDEAKITDDKALTTSKQQQHTEACIELLEIKASSVSPDSLSSSSVPSTVVDSSTKSSIVNVGRSLTSTSSIPATTFCNPAISNENRNSKSNPNPENQKHNSEDGSGSGNCNKSQMRREDLIKISEPSEVKSLPVRPANKELLVDIGLQTDLEEDPEVYYFAGGRHVGSQTDCDEGEYEPLIPFVANTKLEIIVLTSSPPGPCVSSTNDGSEIESSTSPNHLIEVKETEITAVNSPVTSTSTLTPTTATASTTTTSSESTVVVPEIGSSIVDDDYNHNDNDTTKVPREVKADAVIITNNNNNVVATKAKEELQSSVNVLRGVEKEKDGWKTVTARSNRTKWSQSSSSLGSSAANSSRGSLDRGSMGDYRDNRDRGSIGSGSNSGSVRGRLNSSGSAQVSMIGGSRGSSSQSHHNSSSNCSGSRQQRNNLTSVNNSRENPAWKVCGPARGSISNASNSANYLKSRFYQPSSTISLPVLNDPHDDRIRVSDGKRPGYFHSNSSAKKLTEVEPSYGSREKLFRKKTSLAANLDVCGSPNKSSKIQKPALQQRSTQTTKKPGMSVGVGHSVTSKVVRDETTSSGTTTGVTPIPPTRKPRSEVSTATNTSFTSTSNLKQRNIAINTGGKIGSSQPTSASKFVNNLKQADSNKERSFVTDNRLNLKKKIESNSTSSVATGQGSHGSRVTKVSGSSTISSTSTTATSNSNSNKTTTSAAATYKKPVTTAKNSSNNNVRSHSANTASVSNASNNLSKICNSKTAKSVDKVLDKSQQLRQVTEIEAVRDHDPEDTEMIINANDKWKEEKDTESSNDDEEIQMKEAALESVIKESELLAEELLQVEKDFEEIENRAADNVSVDEASVVSDGCETTSSPSTFPESETETEIGDFCSDLDQFFFIAINNDRNSPLNCHMDENIEERIVAKKEKLRLSPAKKCDSAETLKRHRAKLAKAERNRERLLQAKYNRYVELSERFASLNETTKRLVEERSELTAKADERRKRAAEKRKLYLKSIVKKAHDEDSKAKEIAFINLLEAQNKRHDYLANVQEVEDRLNSIQEERKLKFEDRAVKVQAVIERQGHIRHGWETKLAAMQEKRRKINERIMREKEERAKERSELAQEKARDREERISALNAAKQAEKEELQKKILQKQQETARRHEENIEQIRQKAIELTLPRTPEDTGPVTIRMCSLCKVTMQSEVQELAHLRGRSHLDAVRKLEQENGGSKIEQFGLKFITDVQVDKIEPGIRHDKNRSKKHCKKLMLRLQTNGEEFEKAEQEQRFDKPWGDPSLKAKVLKHLRELERACSLFSCGKGTLSIANSMDKLLAEIRRTINKNKSVQDAIVGLKTFSVVSKILQCTSPDLPPKILIGACNLIVGATYQHLSNGVYVLRSTVICSLIELVVCRLNNLIPDGNRWLTNSVESNESLQADSVADFAIETLFTLLSIVPDPYDGITRQKDSRINDSEILDITYRTQDIIGYLVAANVVDRLSVYCSSVQGPVDNQPGVANLLKISLDFLTALVWCLTFCLERRSSLNGGKREVDPTQLLATLESSELAGSVSMSYALLLYQGAPTRPRLVKQTDSEPSLEDSSLQAYNNNSSTPPPPPGSRTASVVKSTLCLVNAVARLDIQALQNVLGSEAVSLQFRHIASQLLWQVVPHREDRAMWGLLQELFIAIGNFTVKNLHNQVTIQSGQTPTVLQQLCVVAKEFLSDLRLSRSILPTLIAATHGCPENRELLIQENFPTDLLDGFLESKFSYANIILKRLVSPPPSSGLCSSNSSSSTTIGK